MDDNLGSRGHDNLDGNGRHSLGYGPCRPLTNLCSLRGGTSASPCTSSCGLRSRLCDSIGSFGDSSVPLMRVNPTHPQPELLRIAADVARRGGVLVLPTDTVYGIAVAVPVALAPAPAAAPAASTSGTAAPAAPAATAPADGRPDALYRLKGRDVDKPIPWLVSGAEALVEYMDGVRCAGGAMPDIAYKLAQAHWPGALTLVVPAARQLPPGFRASDGSIALRAPDNAIAQGILAELGQPLATSSANLQGMPPASSVQGLDFRLAQDVDLIIDGGPVAGGLPSTIVSCFGQRPLLLREGAIPAAALMLD